MSSSHQANSPILIYQMGKVGSTSVHHALRKARIESYQLHCLNPIRLQEIEQKLLRQGLGTPKHIKQSRQIRSDYLDRDIPVKIICPIRHPLRRNISAFFQQLPMKLLSDPAYKEAIDMPNDIKLVQRMMLPHEWLNAYVLSKLPNILSGREKILVDLFLHHFDHDTPLNWCQKELEATFGIDLFSMVDTEAFEHVRLQKDGVDLLLYKCEMSLPSQSELISSFLNRSDIQLIEMHTTRTKKIHPIKKKFESILSLPTQLARQYTDSVYTRTFYPATMTRRST